MTGGEMTKAATYRCMSVGNHQGDKHTTRFSQIVFCKLTKDVPKFNKRQLEGVLIQ